jgi:hypothetical protein
MEDHDDFDPGVILADPLGPEGLIPGFYVYVLNDGTFELADFTTHPLPSGNDDVRLFTGTRWASRAEAEASLEATILHNAASTSFPERARVARVLRKLKKPLTRQQAFDAYVSDLAS